MCVALVERHKEVGLVLAALVAREHPPLVGPPGTTNDAAMEERALRQLWLQPTRNTLSHLK